MLESVEALGIDIQDVAAQIEIEGVAAFENSFENLLETLRQKAQLLRH